MRTAIDRLHLGKEKEIDIYAFDGYKEENRFVCPECGEYVFAAVGKRNGFRHYKKKDIECDLRVDGQVACTYFERVGLPLYLQKNGSTFILKIGFYPLNNKLLDLAVSRKAKVVISSGTHYNASQSVFNIDNINFCFDTTTLLPLNFVPLGENNYNIDITDKLLGKQILEYWSDYADGFTSYGALFTYSENGGKKIRRNDTIEANTTYYWMIPSGYFRLRNGLNSNFVSTISLDKKNYDIYSIIVEHKNESEFRALAKFFWDCLRVRLLYVKPEINPLWPPVIKTKQYDISLQCNPRNSALFCSIKSDSDKPVIYQYLGSEYKQIPVHGDETQPKWSILNLSQLIQPYTIDRKYLANSLMICQKSISIFASPQDVFICLSDDVPKTSSDVIYIDKSCRKIEIKSPKKIVVICWNKNKPLNTYNISLDETIEIRLDEKLFEIWVVDNISGHIVCKIKKNLKKHKGDNELIYDSTLLQIIKKYVGEKPMPIPRKYKSIVFAIKKHPICNSLLAKNISRGEIQPSILKNIIEGGLLDE